MLLTSSVCDEFQAIATAETQDLTQSVCKRLWLHVERLLAPLPSEEKLYFAGIAIERIATAIADRADWLLAIEELASEGELQEYLGLPSVMVLDQFVGNNGPTLNFNSWVDESLLPSAQSERHSSVRGKPQRDEVSSQKVKGDLLAQTKERQFEETQQAISAFFGQHPTAITLPELQQALGLPLVEVWLGLLLGGYKLEQRGEFYDTAAIEILGRQEILAG